MKPKGTVAKLFGRCLTLQLAGETFQLKVMGDKKQASVDRETLLGALALMGVEVVQAAPTTGAEESE